jgi:predicted nucleic acid-binding Zn ribbon protein
MKYEYTCPTCYITVYVERSIHAEASPQPCLECNKEMLRKYEAPAITFKGGGFYSTDQKG